MAHCSSEMIAVIGSNPTDETLMTVGMSILIQMSMKGLVLFSGVVLNHDNLKAKAILSWLGLNRGLYSDCSAFEPRPLPNQLVTPRPMLELRRFRLNHISSS